MTAHGNWPLYPPPDEPSEMWELYEAASAPIETGRCMCEAVCECEEATGELYD